MDFRKLQAFSKVYEHRSFSKAGQELFLSQPTISAHIQGLEDELGLSLFDRLGRTIVPTPAAEVLYCRVIEAFERLTRARSEIDQLQNRIAGEINIGASTIPAHWVLPKLMASFSTTHQDVTFSLKVDSTKTIYDRVISGELECGMVGAKPAANLSLSAVPFVDDEIVAVTSPELAGRLEGTAIDVWPWIQREKGSGTRKVFEDALEAAGKGIARPKVAIQIESTQGVLAFAGAGCGVGVVSRLAARSGIDSGTLQILDLGIAPITRKLYAIHLTGRSLLPATQAFLEYLRHIDQGVLL